MNKTCLGLLTILCQAIGVSSVHAADMKIKITNLSNGLHFSSALVAAHKEDQALFTPGEEASEAIQAMAEGGNLSPLEQTLKAASVTMAKTPDTELLAPGQSTELELRVADNDALTQLSMVSALLPSNDGFAGLNAVDIPTTPGTYTFDVNAYDAGTEANNETRGSGKPGESGFHIPADSALEKTTGEGGVGIETKAENFIHIHRNVLGDDDNTGGKSDIDSRVHRWLNPVMRVTVIIEAQEES